MRLLALGIALAVSDAVIIYLQVRERDAWAQGDIRRSVLLDGATALVIGTSIILLAVVHWALLPFSVAGTMAGRWLAWRL